MSNRRTVNRDRFSPFRDRTTIEHINSPCTHFARLNLRNCFATAIHNRAEELIVKSAALLQTDVTSGACIGKNVWAEQCYKGASPAGGGFS